MNTITDYIISLTHLYGLVHKDKVVEIYNMQNEDKIEKIDTVRLKADNISIDSAELDNNFVEVFNDYFVHEAIMEFNDFNEQLEKRAGKPFYIPEQEELLKYKDNNYFEINKEYKDLLEYATKRLFDGDEWQAEMLVEDIQVYCQQNFSPEAIIDLFNQRCVSFEGIKQVNEVLKLVMNLANNTRIWENNGHTPNEIFEKFEKPKLKPLPAERFLVSGKSKKIGRNDPCPCGSGKKYKKCCLGKE
jgi:preprotein translocase subunit SecA